MSRRTPHRLAGAVTRHILLMAVAAYALLPLLWMLLTSLKSPEAIFDGGLGLARLGYWQNYVTAFAAAPLGRYLLNGVLVTAAIFALQVLVALPAAYALAKLRFRGHDLAFGLVLLAIMIPYQAVAVPVFLLLHQLGLLNTYAGLVLPFVISAFGIFLMRQFFATVPDELLDAARLDGISEFAMVWRVMLPLSWPALIAFGIFSVVAHWNDYFWPLIAVADPELFTPPLGIVAFRNDEAGTQYGPLMAAATIVILPLLIAFLAMQRRFVEGITFNGMK
jgi:multiple sugar transport system permease protein